MNPLRIFKYAGRSPFGREPLSYIVLDGTRALELPGAATDDALLARLTRDHPGATFLCDPSMQDAAARWPCEVRPLSAEEAMARAHLGASVFLPKAFDLVDHPFVLRDFFRAARALEVACREATAMWHARITIEGRIGDEPLATRLGASLIGGATPDLALGGASSMAEVLAGTRELRDVDRFVVTFLPDEGAVDALKPVYSLEHAPRPFLVGDGRLHPVDPFGLEQLAAVLTALAGFFSTGARRTTWAPALGGGLVVDVV